MKKLFSFVLALFLFYSYSLFAIDNLVITESQKAYQIALEYYEKQNYGKALQYCEDAIALRKETISGQKSILEKALVPAQVRKAGDKISEIIPVLEERGEKESVKIIQYYVKRKEEGFFDDSIKKLLEYLSQISEFPEVQKLIGDIYKIEGEYDFAEDYYMKALSNAKLLDIPDEKYEILYLLTDISRLKNDYNMMEKRLLNILSDDKYFGNSYLRKSIIKTLKTQKNSKSTDSTIDKFFELYRADGYYYLESYIRLAEYYDSVKEYDKALELCSLAVITSYTKMLTVIENRNSSFVYDGLNSVLEETAYYDDILQWGSDNNIWFSFIMLADLSEKLEYKNFASDLLTSFAKYCPVEYWRREAVVRLDGLQF